MARVAFTDNASGRRVERKVQLRWPYPSTRDGVRSAAIRVVEYWPGTSDPVVVATLMSGDTDWVEEERSDDA